MNILDTLKQLRDDIKAWVTNNLNALNAKIDEKTIPIDSELSSTSTNPVQNKAIKKAIDNIPTFSGDYNDLTNAPNISEDDSGNMVIADESGNIIFKADADGIHTTAVSLNGEAAATEKYVDEAVANIPTPDVSGQINAHNTSDEAHADIRKAIEDTKEELSESIVAESEEWKVIDEAGNIIFSVDASGAHTTELTLNGESAATEKYVDDAIAEIPTPDVSGQINTHNTSATAHEDIRKAISDVSSLVGTTSVSDQIDAAIADFIEQDPKALEALQELSQALEEHEDAYDALLETVGGKATHTDLENLKTEISESIVSETTEFHIVDDAGNIVASIDENGIATTTVTAQSIIVNGDNVEEHIDNTSIHVTATEKKAWNEKSNFSGSYNDLTDKPAPTDLSNYYTKTEVDDAIENTVPDWAKEATKPSYTAEEIGLGNVNNTSDLDKPVSTATQTAIDGLRTELSESIVSENDEWKIVDEAGNIVFSVGADGAHTTSLTVNGIPVEPVDHSVYQTKIDTNLETSDKTIVGAINELNNSKMPYVTINDESPLVTLQVIRDAIVEATDTESTSCFVSLTGYLGRGLIIKFYSNGPLYRVYAFDTSNGKYITAQSVDISTTTISNFLKLEETHQTKTDETLETASKEIVGAINELNSGKTVNKITNILSGEIIEAKYTGLRYQGRIYDGGTLIAEPSLFLPIVAGDNVTIEPGVVDTEYNISAFKISVDSSGFNGIPPYDPTADEGKFLRIVGGVPTWVAIPNAEEATF